MKDGMLESFARPQHMGIRHALDAARGEDKKWPYCGALNHDEEHEKVDSERKFR